MSKYVAPGTSNNVPGIQPSPLYLRNSYLYPDMPQVLPDPLNIPAPPASAPLLRGPSSRYSPTVGPQVTMAPPPVIPVWQPNGFRGYGLNAPSPVKAIPSKSPSSSPMSFPTKTEATLEVLPPGSGYTSAPDEAPINYPTSTMIAPPPVIHAQPQFRPKHYPVVPHQSPHERAMLVNPAGTGHQVSASMTESNIMPEDFVVYSSDLDIPANAATYSNSPPPLPDTVDAVTQVVAIAPAPTVSVNNNAADPTVTGSIQIPASSAVLAAADVVQTMKSTSVETSNKVLWVLGGVVVAGAAGLFILKRRRKGNVK